MNMIEWEREKRLKYTAIQSEFIEILKLTTNMNEKLPQREILSESFNCWVEKSDEEMEGERAITE